MNPGWYSDPNGGPGLRWWDGSSWTDHISPPPAVVPAEAPTPGPAPSFSPGPAPSFPAASPGSSGGFPPSQQQGAGRRNLVVGLGALAALVLAIGGFVLVSGDGETSQPETTTATDSTTTTTEDASTTTTTSTAPASEFVSSGGLTFTRLPEPWEDWLSDGRGQIAELQGTAGQFVVVQEQAPSGGQWIGNLLIGDLATNFTYGGEADLPAATQDLAAQLIANYYVAGAESSVVLERPVTIDGRSAYFIHHELTFSQEGLETTREKVIVVVVDTGRPRPGVFWASIPYNRIDLNDGMDEVYRTLQVND